MATEAKPGTVGQLIEAEMSLTAYCACGHSRQIDLEGLESRLGRDHIYIGQAIRFYCARCGARPNAVIVGGAGTQRITGRY